MARSEIEYHRKLVEHGFGQGYAAALRAAVDKMQARLKSVRGRAADEETRGAARWAPKRAMEMDLLVNIIQELKGYPNRGISCIWEIDYPVGAGHPVKIYGIPAFGPVRYEAVCSCGPGKFNRLGWSVHIIGAKRLARQHGKDEAGKPQVPLEWGTVVFIEEPDDAGA